MSISKTVSSPRRKTTLERAKQATSWLALVAATSIGVAASSVAAEIRTTVETPSRGTLRLVVQAFGDDAARPVCATQRAVTAEELRRGIRVDVVEVAGELPGASRVVAWVEEGDADLEFDGRTAKPGKGSLVGEAVADEAGRVSIVLS